MSNSINRPSVRNLGNTALDRIAKLEESHRRLAVAVNESLVKIDKHMQMVLRQMDAVVGLIGVDEVTNAIEANEKAAESEAAAETQVNIAKAVEEGKLVRAEAITEKSLFTCVEYSATGEVIHPGFAAISFASLTNEEEKKGLLGLKVGSEYTAKSGTKLTISGIYVPGTPAPKTEPVPALAVVEAPSLA